MGGGKERVRWVRVKGRAMNDMGGGFSKKLFFLLQVDPINIICISGFGAAPQAQKCNKIKMYGAPRLGKACPNWHFSQKCCAYWDFDPIPA